MIQNILLRELVSEENIVQFTVKYLFNFENVHEIKKLLVPNTSHGQH